MPELIKGNIRLRPFREEDKTDIARLCNNRKIWDNIRDFVPHPYAEKDAEEFISFCKKENPQVTFVIEYENRVAGVIGLVPQKDIYRHSAEVGYWLGEPFWGKGIMTEAVKLITGYGFNELGLYRIFTGIFASNKASQRVVEKAGYKFEGVFEKGVIKNGELMDEVRYGKIKRADF